MTKSWFSKEPLLSFAGNNPHIDPMAGLSLFGPFLTENVGSIKIGIIGSQTSVSETQNFIETLQSEILEDDTDPILFPRYPGSEKAFKVHFQVHNSLIEQFSHSDIEKIIALSDSYERVIRASDLYLTRLDSLKASEPAPDVIICSIPKEFEEHCWSSNGSVLSSKQKLEIKSKNKLSKKGQLFLDQFDEEMSPVVEVVKSFTDLRSKIKSGAMLKGVKTQIILETSMNGEKITEPKQAVAWNLSVALFYKANGFPWRLSITSENDCFVGITFYRERIQDGIRMGTSVAQIFDKSGDGMILKGGKLILSRDEDKSPHLSYDDSFKLAKSILEVYNQRNRRPPERVVLHKSSKFWQEELEGIRAGLGDDIKIDFVAIERSDIRVVRDGEYPPLRGTCLELSESEYLIYGMGYIPYLGTYPGHHIPQPLHVVQHIGEATPQKICEEILGLTKMNWNTAHFCNGIPITLNIARKVSAILKEVPDDEQIEPSYRFYM